MAQVERGHISEIQQHESNANAGTVRGRAVLEQSIRKHGAGRSLVLDKNKKAIAGNHAAEVLAEVGIEDVVFVHTTGHEVVAVVRDDLDLDAEDPTARSLAIHDNRASELGLAWDATQLMAVMDQSEDVKHLFTPGEAARLMAQGEGEAKKYQLIPLLFTPDELADMQAAWEEIAKSSYALEHPSEWWIARFEDYDRLMNGVGEVMDTNRKLRYVHQAIMFLVKFWRQHKGATA